MRKFVAYAAFACFVAILPAAADQVTLTNGDRLTGTITTSDGKTLTLHTDYAGDIVLKMSAVQSLQSDESIHVELKDGRKAAGTLATNDGNIEVSEPSGARVQAPIPSIKTLRDNAEQAAYERTLHPGFFQEWKAGLNGGFSLTRGNSQTKNLAIGFIAARQTLRDKLSLYQNSVYATNDAAGAVPATTANAAGGGVRYDHDVRDDLFAFANADFFADALQ